MRIETLDLSHLTDDVCSQYKRLSKTQIRMLSSQVPESFIEKFSDEKTALKELLDAIYGANTEDYD